MQKLIAWFVTFWVNALIILAALVLVYATVMIFISSAVAAFTVNPAYILITILGVPVMCYLTMCVLSVVEHEVSKLI
jgi:hypothetical protein